MKKLLLSIIMITGLVAINFAQNTVHMNEPAKSLKVDKRADYSEPQTGTTTDIPYSRTGSFLKTGGVVTEKQIGSSSNIYTIIGGTDRRHVDASTSLSTITFIHRNNIGLNPGTNGFYMYDISTDTGNTWVIDQGEMNPSADDAPVRGRYPNLFLWNPTAGANPNDAYIVYFGAIHYGGTGSYVWRGAMAGTYKLDGTTIDETVLDVKTIYNSSYVSVVPGSLVPAGTSGKFYALDIMIDSLHLLPSKLLFFKGIWDGVTETSSWSLDTMTLSSDTASTYSTPYIAFNETGVNGWMVVPGDMINDGNDRYDLYFYQSSDTGNTWTLHTALPLNNIGTIDSAIYDTVIFTGPDTVATYPIVWEGDLRVDANGDPHFFTQVGHGSGFSIYYGVHRLLYDISYSNATGWTATFIDTARTFGSEVLGGTGFWHYSRPEMALNDSRDMIFYFWCDSDPTMDGTNSFPDIYGKAYNLTTKLFSESFNFTINTAWESQNHFPTVSRTALDLGNNRYRVPVVVTAPGGTPDDPPDFYYLHNIDFGAPIANFGHDYKLGYGGKVNFYDSSSYTPSVWAWTFDDPTSGQNSSALKNPTHTFSDDGTYNVCLTVTNSYGSDNTCKDVFVDKVGVNEIDLEDAITIKPNPTNGPLQIAIDIANSDKATIKLYNLLGDVIIDNSYQLNNLTTINLDLTGNPNGIYFLKMKVNDLVITKKVTMSNR